MSEQMPNMDYDADEVINDFKAKFKWPKKRRGGCCCKAEQSMAQTAYFGGAYNNCRWGSILYDASRHEFQRY